MSIIRKSYNLLCSPKLLHYVLPIVIGYLIIGTVAQKYIGLYQATQIFFSAPIIWISDIFPILGMPVFMGLIFVNLTFKLVFKSPWSWRSSGIIITHIGVLLLLLGGIFTALFSSAGYLALSQGEVKSIISEYEDQKPIKDANKQLPFSIELLEFKKQSYAGTKMAKSYQSTVLIRDDNTKWQSVISMNQPLRYKGYTFFQSSFITTEQGEISVLAVVQNVGRSFPYISGILMCIGIILHLLMRRPKAIASILLLLTLSPNAYAFEVKDFAQLPILHAGRIQPIDSFARTQLKNLSGRDHGAVDWLVEVIFDPTTAELSPVIKITNPEILSLLNLAKRKSRLYSYREVSTALRSKQAIIMSIVKADEASWSPQQRELVTLQEKLVSLRGLMSSMSAFLPLSVTLPSRVTEAFKPYAGKEISYSDALMFRDELQDTMASIIAAKSHDVASYSEGEQALAQLSFTLGALQDASRNATVFKVIPATPAWLSPWEALLIQGDESSTLSHWQDLSAAHYSGDEAKWNAAIEALTNDDPKLRLEYYYNRYNPFYIGFGLCILALIALSISSTIKDPCFRRESIVTAAYWLLSAALAFQTIGIAARIFILERPPVSTLYETILFVTLIVMIYAVIAAYKSRAAMWLWAGAGLGVLLHILGFAHSADGDSFVVLPAVLNTNFWLTTHVLCITAAYGFCALTSLLAHYALIKMMRGRSADKALHKTIHSAALLALLLAASGTVLGGIWADQSWGRFWGWDPKENGALLIVLWLIWALHGRISGQMKITGQMLALAYLSVILALSWFGVNLLGVGLHAYGFSDTHVWSLGGFVALESLFIILASIRIRHEPRSKQPNTTSLRTAESGVAIHSHEGKMDRRASLAMTNETSRGNLTQE